MKILSISLLVAAFFVSAESAYSQEVLHEGSPVDISKGPEICLTCHDDLDMESQTSDGDNTVHAGHPRSINYPPAGREEDFRPSSEVVSAGILLPDSRISCISCHDLNNPEPYYLVIQNVQSRLCLACHKV